MSIWNSTIPKKPSLDCLKKIVISDELKLKIQKAYNNAKPDPKLLEMYRDRPLTYKQLHTLYN